jgi:hypothetical protein
MRASMRRAVLMLGLCAATPAMPADSGISVAGPLDPSGGIDFSGFELRGGALVSTWGPERGELNLNAEAELPKFFRLQGWADYLVPRLQAGIVGNLGGGTSYAYAGPLWTVNYGRAFAGLALGGAVHNGQIEGHYTDPGRNRLGCRVLFHVAFDVGYRITEALSAMVTFDHISNGSGTLSSCGANEGVSVLGLRIGYSF